MLPQIIGLEYQVIVLAAGPLSIVLLRWITTQFLTHIHDQRATAYAARLVTWAMQVIPDKSTRYNEVKALLTQKFPSITGTQLEVLIESEVLSLKMGFADSAARLSQGPTDSNSSTTGATGQTLSEASPYQSIAVQDLSQMSGQ